MRDELYEGRLALIGSVNGYIFVDTIILFYFLIAQKYGVLICIKIKIKDT